MSREKIEDYIEELVFSPTERRAIAEAIISSSENTSLY
jgi:hypothetical protein